MPAVTLRTVGQSPIGQTTTSSPARTTPLSATPVSYNKWKELPNIIGAELVEEFIAMQSVDEYARSITEMQIDQTDDHPFEKLGDGLWNVKLPQLATVDLRSVAVDAESLSKFFQTYKQTLTHVVLEKVTLTRSAPDPSAACRAWIKVLEALRDCKKLQSLQIFEIGWQGHADPHSVPAYKPEFARAYIRLPQAKYLMKSSGRPNNRDSFYRLSRYGVTAKAVVKDAINAFVGEIVKTMPADSRYLSCDSRPYATCTYERP